MTRTVPSVMQGRVIVITKRTVPDVEFYDHDQLRSQCRSCGRTALIDHTGECSECQERLRRE